MYGELMITFKLNTETGEPATEPEGTLGEGGRLAEEQGAVGECGGGIAPGRFR
jgi:hypothetical protein